MNYKNMGRESINNNKMKIYSVISIWSILLALIMIYRTPVTGSYEISIFGAYPIYTWIFLFLALAIGIIMVLDSSQRIWKAFGVSIALYVNIMFLLLPILRNYALYGRSDVITHLAYIKELILTNNISLIDYYPISHLIVVNGHFITGLDVNIIINLIPVIFFVLYFVGLYLFAKEIASKITETLLIVIFGTVLMFSYYGTMFLPTQLSFATIPLVLFLILRSKNNTINGVSYGILLIIFLTLMPFFHPLTSVNLVFIFLVIMASLLFTKKNNKLSFNYKDFLNPQLFLLVSFIAWISSKTIFDSNIRRIYNWMVYDIGTPTIDNYKGSLISSNLELIKIIEKIFLGFGHEIIYVLITVMALVIFIRESFKKRELNHRTTFLSLSVITFVLLSGLFLLGSYGISNPLREFVYVLFFCTIINGIFFYRILYNSNEIITKKGKYFLISLIILCSVIGLYSSYASVSIGETNSQVTNAEFVGMQWFYDNKDINLRIYDVDKSTVRFSDIFNGMNYTKQKKWMFKIAPEHFNFTNETGYLVLNEYVIQRHSNYWPDNPYFSSDDLKNLDNSYLLNKVYDNADTQIWGIN